MGVADCFIQDVKACVTEILKDPNADCGGAVSLFLCCLCVCVHVSVCACMCVCVCVCV